MLFRESPHNYRRIGSSGLNLACEGLLLVMQVEGHDICDIPTHFLQGKSATRQGFGLVGVGAKPDRMESSRCNGWCQRSPP
jgi:hypothetical protein